MRKERLTYRDLLRQLGGRPRLLPQERLRIEAVLGSSVPESQLADTLLAVLESLVERGVLLRLSSPTQDNPQLRRYVDPETNDRWAFSVAPNSRGAIDLSEVAPGNSKPAIARFVDSDARPESSGTSETRTAEAAPAPKASTSPTVNRAGPTHVEEQTLSEAANARVVPIERPKQSLVIETVHPEPGVARRFLDSDGEPLKTLFTSIASRRAEDELAETFEPIRGQLLRITSALEARIHLLAPDQATLVSVPSRDGDVVEPQKLAGQLSNRVLALGESLLVNDLAAAGGEPRGVRGSLVTLPLVSGTDILGILEIFAKEPGGFSTEEINLFALVAQVVAGFVHRADHLEKLIFIDKLTGLYNRAYFDDQIEREIERANRSGTSVALLMADLDHFKRINDNYGHQAGDKALTHLAAIFRANIRQIDIAARYGGEEFAILLPSITRARAVRTAERLRRVVADARFSEVIPELVGMKMSISLGLALYPDDAATSKQLIDRADRVALYAAKNRGRNRVVSWASAREGTEPLKSSN